MKNGMVAAGHSKTAEAARIILDQGGNAFDAIVAACLAQSITEPVLTSLAGGGFCLAHTQNGKNLFFDFFVQTPKNKKPEKEIEFYGVDVDFGETIQQFHIGKGSMAVPGNLAGYFKIHQMLGKLPLKVVAEPALKFAREGIVLNSFQAFTFELLKPIIQTGEYGKKLYCHNEKVLKENDTFKCADIADTLEFLINSGVDEFYKGEIARRLAKDAQESGGHLTYDDLAGYKVNVLDPIRINFYGNSILTSAPPSSGGILIAFSLKLLESLGINKYNFNTAEYLDALSSVMEKTNIAREKELDANLFEKNIIDSFLSDEQIRAYAKMLANDSNKWGSTTHVSVIDSEGNAASLTNSYGEGCGYIIPGTGIMMNNMLGEEDLNPGGFHRWKEGVRMSSMMSPTIILENEKAKIALGSGGSNRIRTAVLQVIVNILVNKMDIKNAVDSSRIHWEKNLFNIEPGYNSEEIEKLKNIVNRINKDKLKLWDKKSLFFGGVHAVIKNKNGFEGAGDSRRNGATA